MFSDLITLPPKSIIAGTTLNLLIYLYSDKNNRQIDASGMVARFSIKDFFNEDEDPIFTKNCSITKPDGESVSVLEIELTRSDTINLFGKYIYQITINKSGSIQALKGVMNIANSLDKNAI